MNQFAWREEELLIFQQAEKCEKAYEASLDQKYEEGKELGIEEEKELGIQEGKNLAVWTLPDTCLKQEVKFIL